jgi:hypothetical protein
MVIWAGRVKKWGRAAMVGAMVAVVSVPQPAMAWGNKGHQMINRLAWERLPKGMPRFLRSKNVGAEIEYLGPEPDRWRGASVPELSGAQGPEHYINFENADKIEFENAGKSGTLPRQRWEFVHALSVYAAAHPEEAAEMRPEKVGLQPWEATEVEERLQTAFRAWREAKDKREDASGAEAAIVFYMGWLGHYVADGSQPLHTTVQYNGWVGANPQGYTTSRKIHEQFETAFVDANISAQDVELLMGTPVVLGDVFADYVKYLRASNAQVETLYQMEKTGGFTGAGTAASRKFTEERLAAGATMLDSMWETAWEDSAKPEPARK